MPRGHKGKCALVIVAGLLAGVPALAGIDARKSFDENCSGCHSIGGGQVVGPDLRDVFKRRSRDWVVHYISEPDELRRQNDPAALELRKKFGDSEMPNLGISHEDAEALADYILKTGGGADAGVAVAETPPAAKGDAGRGRAFFLGTAGFKNGGPACLGCHAAATPSGAPGGTLGPDLTTAASRMGAAGLLNALRTVPFPTMKPLYKEQALTEDEQADVAAYLVDVSGGATPGSAQRAGSGFVVAGAAGFAGLLIAFHLIWAGRLRGVRRNLVKLVKKESK